MNTTRHARAVRPKKLLAKAVVSIFREDQVDTLVEFDSLRGNIETGVEKAEEAVCPPYLVVTQPHCRCTRLVMQLLATTFTQTHR